MKILLLASRVPYPLYNGEDLRIFHFAKYLSQDHELHLVAYGSGSSSAPEAACYFKRIHTLEAAPTNGANGRLMSRLLQAFSPDHLYSFDPQICSVLSRLLEEERFDLVWIPAWQMIPYARHIRHVPIFVDVMDDGVLELGRELRSCGSLGEATVTLKRLFVTYLFERRYFRRVALCSLASERDAEVLSWVCPTAKQVVIPNGVDTHFYKPLGLGEDFPSIIFEGNMSFAPSVDAILHFCNKTLPLIQNKIPEIKLYIVGKDPPPEILRLAEQSIIVTGYVEDVRPYLDRASVFICPMRKGAGIKNKILQAWAMGKPVVATPIALGGLCAQLGKNIMAANGPSEFAEKVTELFERPGLRRELGRGGLETVRNHYSWERQVQLLEDAFRSL